MHWDNGLLAVQMLHNLVQQKSVLSGYDERFRVFGDMTYGCERFKIEANWFYRTLDKDYPGSFFIYNTRDMRKWLESRLNHLDGRYLEMHKRIYDTRDVRLVMDRWARERLAFEAAVSAYFSGRDNLLVLDIEDADAPAKISAFLGRPMAASAWGWEGKTGLKRFRVSGQP